MSRSAPSLRPSASPPTGAARATARSLWATFTAPPAAASPLLLSRSVAFLYLGGSVIAWVSTLLPGAPPPPGASVLRVLGVVGIVLAAVIWRWSERLPRWWMQHVWSSVGIVMVGVAALHSGGGHIAAAYVTLYAVIVIHVFSAMSWVIASGHLVLIIAVVDALLVTQEGVRPATAAVCSGVLVLIAACVGALARAGAVVEVDPLTGVLNRRGLDRHLADELSRAGRRGRDVSVALLDLDDFKAVNDALGHAGGDALLIALARSWEEAQRAEGVTGVLCRQGGDEFVAVLSGATCEQAASVVARTRAALPEGQRCSAGTAQWVRPLDPPLGASRGETPEQLLRRADAALYRAKRQAKGTTVTAGTDPDPGADLHRGLAAGELVVHYQPVVAVGKDGAWAVVGAEALVRWQHPQRGLLTPPAFLADARAARLTPLLGRAVLATVVRQAAGWTTSFGCPLPVSVNAAPEELRDPQYATRLLDQLAAASFAPERLCVEVVEDDLRSTDVVLENLRRLREAGIRVAVDDFGVGYSNLARLAALPLDVLKIDRSLTSAVAPQGDGSMPFALLTAILTLAESAELDVVVEGVETAEQARWLADDALHGAAEAGRPSSERATATFGQGWFWSRALPGEAFVELVTRQAGNGTALAAR